ncbi:MAG: hypothetical protein JNL21_38025 [Myxococcales bacterium]|nr:hypothetical protein [Myxococcales bacterium]
MIAPRWATNRAPLWGAARATAICALSVAACLTGCASTFDGSTYRGSGFVFEVPPAPASWQRMDVSDAALTYEDAATGATILVNGRCDRDGEDVPLRSLTQHLFIYFTDREIHEEKVVPFDGREAMRTDITAKLDGVQRRFVVWVMKKDKCVYDLTYIAPPDRFDTGVPAFDTWASGFRARREGGE